MNEVGACCCSVETTRLSNAWDYKVLACSSAFNELIAFALLTSSSLAALRTTILALYPSRKTAIKMFYLRKQVVPVDEDGSYGHDELLVVTEFWRKYRLEHF